MTDLPRRYERSASGFGARLAAVRPDQWDDTTPCTDWSVRELVAHVLDEQLWIPPLAAGESIAEVGDRFAGDQLGGDALAAWQRAQAGVATAIDVPDAGTREVQLSYGPSTLEAYVRQVCLDVLIHTWDLARAIGVDEQLPEDDVAEALAFYEANPGLVQASGLFAAVVPVEDGADPQTRLLGLLGRPA